jgi:outer membrane protein OmpA-like peptidoglycan-associated protein
MTLRDAVAVVAVGAGLAMAAQAAAGQAGPAKPSVEGYICQFAGKCAAEVEPAPTRDAPETRGFRLARSPGAKEAKASVPASAVARGRSASTAARAPASTGRRSSYAATTARAATAAETSMVPGGRPRADLMIGFELNSDRLTPVGRESAMVFARSLLMPELRSMRFLIEGHTDERGGRGINGPLSQRRAQRVASFLIEQGVAPDRLQTRGFGSSRPLPGHRAADPSNRRVEAELIS